MAALKAAHRAPPPRALLERQLAALATGVEGERLELVGRRANPFSTTSPSEILACRTSRGRALELFCKHVAWEPGAGTPLEAEVYAGVLARCPLPTPRFYGWWGDARQRSACLVIEYVPTGRRPYHLREPERGMARAAAWIGAFHAYAAARLASLPLCGRLERLDTDRLSARCARLVAARPELFAEHRWLAGFEQAGRNAAERLGRCPPTLLHGEFYPQNILCTPDAIFPVDWERSALGAGEIDLAALIEGWPEDVARRCMRAYARARWNGAPPDDFARTLAAAGALWEVHWLARARRAGHSRIDSLRRSLRRHVAPEAHT